MPCGHLDEQGGSIPEVQVHRLPGDPRPGADRGERESLDPEFGDFLPGGIEQPGVSRRIGHDLRILDARQPNRFTRVKHSLRERA